MSSQLNPRIFFIIAIFTITSCSNLETGGKLLKDKKIKDEIMTSISSDSAMTSDMIDQMVLNNKANHQYKNIIKSMMTKDFLEDLMKDDSVLTNEIMCSVLEMAEKYPLVCKQMQQTIERYGLKQKLGLDLVKNPTIEKDHMQVQEYLKVPPQKTRTK